MVRSVPLEIMPQLEKLASGAFRDVSKISLPSPLIAGSPEYNAARNTIARLRQKGDTELALQLARLLAAAVPEDRKVTIQLARILWADGKYSQSADVLDKLGPFGADHEWYAARAAVSYSIGDYNAGFDLTGKFRHAAPMVITQKERNDLPLVAITNTGPNLLKEPAIAAHLHFTLNFVSQFAKSVSNKFRFSSYWVNVSNIEQVIRSSPVPDLVVNNVASGEVANDPEISSNLEKCLRYWKKPCLNKPKIVRETARDYLASTLSEVEGIIVPKTLYFKTTDEINELVDKIEQDFDYPLILRAPFFQNGGDMFLVEDRDKALEIIPTLEPGFFAIEFINNVHKNNMYRKMRCAFVEDDFFMLRVDYGPDWMIHGHREQPHRIEFYNENPQYLEEEIAICNDPAREFGKPVMKALHELRSIVKLDFIGVDFDISSDGKPIIYEANAAMNFLSKGGLVHPHPKASANALTRRFTKLLMNRIDRPKMAMTR